MEFTLSGLSSMINTLLSIRLIDFLVLYKSNLIPINLTPSHNSRPKDKHKMSDRISNGEWLTPGRKKVSPNGKTELRMQDDGKIAVYREGECLWQNTPNQRDDIVGVRMQQDGNLCM